MLGSVYSISANTSGYDLYKEALKKTHSAEVFSKGHLFERIWRYDSNGDVSTVTVHIRKIREKIEHDPSKPEYIETVWRSGIVFINKRTVSLRWTLSFC